MKNVLRGTAGGAAIGLLIAFVFVGTRVGEGTVGELVLAGSIYVIGGILGGVIAGSLSRWATGWFQAGLVGVISMIPITGMFAWFESALGSSGPWTGVLVVAVLVGFPVGVIYRVIIKAVDPFGPLP